MIMVTSNEFLGALKAPIPISLINTEHEGSYAEFLDDGQVYRLSFNEKLRDRKAKKVAELALWQWLLERKIPSPGMLSRLLSFVFKAEYIDICGRRVEVVADMRPWDEALALPIRSFGMRVPTRRLDKADYYVYCIIDASLNKASLIGYYDGYSLLSHEARTGVVQRCVAVPISWLHPMDELQVILRAGCATEGVGRRDNGWRGKPVSVAGEAAR